MRGRCPRAAAVLRASCSGPSVSVSTGRRGFLATGAAFIAAPAWGRWPNDIPDGLIFFVGNSFTRQHDVAGLVCRIAAETGAAAHCHRQTANGAKLDDSIDTPRALASDWDGRIPVPIVLQDHSTEPLTAESRARSAKAMEAYSRHFDRTVLFETWPRRAGHALYSQPDMPSTPLEMAQLTHEHYTRQAVRLGAALAPIAPAWIDATGEGIDLYAFDGYHANPSGAWLCALLLAQALGLAGALDATPPKTVSETTSKALARIAARAT